MTKYEAVCDRCGSTDVYAEAQLRWSVEEQDWVFDQFTEHTECVECFDEVGIHLVEIETQAGGE